MDYRKLEDGKYVLTLKADCENVLKMNNGRIAYIPNKEYILIVNNGIYSIKNDADNNEEVSTNFSILSWFNVKKIN